MGKTEINSKQTL